MTYFAAVVVDLASRARIKSKIAGNTSNATFVFRGEAVVTSTRKGYSTILNLFSNYSTCNLPLCHIAIAG